MDTIVKFTVILLAAFAIMAVISVVAAIPTYFLWNWLMPDLFALKTITFVQAIGVNFMTAILFKPNITTSKESK